MPVNSFDNYPMSWKPIIDKNAKPLYLTLAIQLEKAILDGTLVPGTKLPPQRELADFLDINLSTISKAFKVCELKGLLSATIGRGTFVSFSALSNPYLLTEQKQKNIIEMGATFPNFNSYEPLKSQLVAIANESTYTKLFGYSRLNDMVWQKDAAVKLIQKCGYQTSINHILFSNGGQNAITSILLGLCQHGDKIGTDPHTYPGIKTAASMLGIQLIPIHQKDNEMDAEALIDFCKNEKLKGIYVIPDYQNPTTHQMSLNQRKNLAQVARQYDIIIIEDATYHLLCKNPLPPIATFAPNHTIYIHSLSKIIAPGLRLAYLAVPEQFKQRLNSALYNMNISVSPLLTELASRIILSNQINTIIESHQNQTIKRNNLVNQYLSKYDCLGDSTCIFRWLKLPPHISGTEFESLAFRQRVQVYSAERFVVGNTPPENAIRFSVCTPTSFEELEAGLKILQKLLKSLD